MTLHPWMVPALVLLAAVAWRFAPVFAWLLAPLALLAAVRLVRRDPAAARRMLPAVLLLVAVLASLRLPETVLWPCSWGCGEVGRYAGLFGQRAEVWALVAAIGAAVTSWQGVRGARLLVWALPGASLVYLGILAALAAACTHCLAVHTAILATAALSLRDGLPWRWRTTAMLATALIIATSLLWPVAPPDPSGLGPPPVGPVDRP